MANIRVTPETLNSQGNDLIGYAGDLAEILGSINTKINEIIDGWDGLAQDAYFDMYTTMKESLDKFPELVNTTYKVVLTRRCANKHTVLKCEGNHILWDQIPALFNWGGSMHGEYRPVYQVGQDKGCTVLFVVRGKPNGVIGLDDGVFRSADKFDENCVNVMTYKQFKKM